MGNRSRILSHQSPLYLLSYITPSKKFNFTKWWEIQFYDLRTRVRSGFSFRLLDALLIKSRGWIQGSQYHQKFFRYFAENFLKFPKIAARIFLWPKHECRKKPLRIAFSILYKKFFWNSGKKIFSLFKKRLYF